MEQTTFDQGSPIGTAGRARGGLDWLSPALIGAMMVSMSAHAVPVIQALRDLMGVRAFVSLSRASLHDALWPTRELEAFQVPVAEARREPPSEPPSQPVRAAAPVGRAAPAREARAAEPPPAAARSGQTQTAPEDSATAGAQVQGDAGAYAGGVSAAGGTSEAAVRDGSARGDGAPGGHGSAGASAPPPASIEPDRSRIARATSSGWNCPFPPEADEEGKDSGTASIMVTVRADGSVQSVKVVSDSGTGFGAAARRCALGQRFEPSLDRAGHAVSGETAPFTVRFTR